MATGEGERPRTAHLELADILIAHPPDPRGISRAQARVVRDLVACRTAALGGHLQKCDCCGHERPVYNSCHNRHCPKCQNVDQALWTEAQGRFLLPVTYFHLVFTVPSCLHPFFRCDPRKAYALLFLAAAETLLDVTRRRLGATPGFIALLHTWTQTLLFHPHVHFIVTSGGISLDGRRWISSRPNFFLPVRVLSELFQGKLRSHLKHALLRGELRMNVSQGLALLEQSKATPWVVYSKPPMAGPKQALRYLSRYTHRIAIGNERLVASQDGNVSFRYRDRAHGNRSCVCTLSADKFIRRFLLHVVPRRFVRVRYYGFLANGIRTARIALARRLLGVSAPLERPQESRFEAIFRLTGSDPLLCPVCRRGRMHTIANLPPGNPYRSRSP